MTTQTIYVSTTAELTAALKSATGGETILLKPTSSPYSISLGQITPASNVTIASADPNNPAVVETLKINESSNLTFSGLVFDSSGATRADYLSDVFVTNSSNIAVVDSVMKNVATQFNDGTVTVGENAVIVRNTDGFAFTGNTVSNYNNGVQITGSTNVLVSGNDISKLQADGLQFAEVSNVVVENNYIHDFLGSLHSINHDDMIQFWTYGTNEASSNISIINNILEMGSGDAVQGIFFGNEIATKDPTRTDMYYRDVTIDGNTVSTSNANAIVIAYSVNSKVNNNVVLQTLCKIADEFETKQVFITLTGEAINAEVMNNVSQSFNLLASVLTANNSTYEATGDDVTVNHIVLTGTQSTHATAGIDRIVGSDSVNTIYAGLGDDIVYAGGGNDNLHGEGGNDVIFGEAGSDHIYGDAGDDMIDAGAGDNYVNGGDGNDWLFAGDGNDKIFGGAGDDYIDGGEGKNSLYGDGGNDTIYGGSASDGIRGGTGNDTIHAAGGDDTARGEDGDDYVYGGTGNDMIYGDAGNDNLYGEDGIDKIWGGADNDHLYGGAGNDTLYGDAGNDRLYGGLGKDTMTGGAGRDYFFFDTPFDKNVDRITDFNAAEDKIALSLSVFTSLTGLTNVGKDNLVFGATAKDANDFLIYNNGVLYYDADGNGSGAAVAFATLDNAAALTFSSFVLVA